MAKRRVLRRGEVYKTTINTMDYYALIANIKDESITVIGVRENVIYPGDELDIRTKYAFYGLSQPYILMENRWGKGSFGQYMGKGYELASEEETAEVKEFIKLFFEDAIKDDPEGHVLI